jgi:RsiW-degrading membrane proteinase PrsW (M82 family)
MSYTYYTIFGVIPSIIWLLYYLRKDKQPESNSMVLRIFFYGMLIAVPTVLVEMGILKELTNLKINPFYLSLLNIFVAVAFIEEFMKYLVVREKVLKHHEFDEPTDAMIYMIISALGFAASENILMLFSLGPVFVLQDTVSLSAFRFVGATFLHALASGSLGFFLAFSLYKYKSKFLLTLLGLGISTLLHGIYNFSIIKMDELSGFFIPLIVLTGLAIFVSLGFRRLKKIKSVCKIY